MPAPLGSHNRARGKQAQLALRRVLARRFGSVDAGLEQAAEVIVRKMRRGIPKNPDDIPPDSELEIADDAARHIFDRIDGKPSQSIEASGPGGGPIETHAMTDDQVVARIAQLVASSAEREDDASEEGADAGPDQGGAPEAPAGGATGA